MGSRKFGSFLVVTTAIAATFEMVAALIFNVTPSSGPFGAIYSMFVLYYGESIQVTSDNPAISSMPWKRASEEACLGFALSYSCVARLGGQLACRSSTRASWASWAWTCRTSPSTISSDCRSATHRTHVPSYRARAEASS